MSTVRKRLSNKNFIFILASVLTLLLVIVIAVSAITPNIASYLDMTLGRGEKHIVVPEGRENWDANYYDKLTPEEAKSNALRVNLQVAEDGMVLLKNNGVLPLDKGASVTPWGKGYVFPFYDSPGSYSSMKHSYDYAVNPRVALTQAGFNIIAHAANLQPATTSTNADPLSPNNQSNFDNYPDQPLAAPETIRFFNSFGATPRIPELGASIYNAAAEEGNTSVFTAAQKTAMADTTALVFISRCGSENRDVKLDGYTDGTRHYLSLSLNEKAMIKAAKALCSKVVVIVNSTNPFELGPVMAGELEADAIVWAGNPGENGFLALGKILCGDVNPSGRLPDIYPTDFLKGPEIANFGDFAYSNKNVKFVDYTEGVYVGYRYYETAHDIGAKDPYDNSKNFVYGTLDAQGGVVTPGAVAYPFGYGLSYTTFTQSVTAFNTSGANISMTVKVTNTGTKTGKDVVQIYYNPPYTQIDKDYKIEKPTANLIEFAKTKLLAPGESQDITLSWSKEEMSSYCSFRENPDGTMGCYMLEAGPYIITLRKNSHEIIETRTWNNDSTIWYDNTNPRQLEKDMQAAMDEEGNILNWPAKRAIDPNAKFIAATNLFHDVTEYMYRDTQPLTRANWNATVPINNRTSGLTSQPHAASETTLSLMWDDRGNNSGRNERYGAVEGSLTWVPEDKMPASNADNGLTVADLRGKDYYDESWYELLDQLDWESEEGITQIKKIMQSNYKSDPIDAIGLPATVHCEGANGIRYDNGGTSQLNRDNSYRTATYAMCPVQAATWNVELMTKLGEAIAAEALANGKSSRYAPAFNIHRSPFSGRNLEYFSECPILTGKIVTAILNGTTSGGLMEYMKHFGLNDQETNRTRVYTWATEQAIREIYNKPFEMCIRDTRKTVKYIKDDKGNIGYRVMRGANAIMTSQNRLGYTTPFSNYDLLQRLTRNEWGFTGIYVTDWYTVNDSWAQAVLLAGGDTILSGVGTNTPRNLPDFDTATVRTALRETIHRVAYNVANSNAMYGAPPGSYIYYDRSPWQNWLTAAQVIAAVLVAGAAVWIVLRVLNEKKHPELYWNDKRDA
jgi:beta-glucosidase